MSEGLQTRRLNRKEPHLQKWGISGADFGLFVVLFLSLNIILALGFHSLATSIWGIDGENSSKMVLLFEGLGGQCAFLFSYVFFQTFFDKSDTPRRSNDFGGAILVGLKWFLFSIPILIAVHYVATVFFELAGIEVEEQKIVQLAMEGGTLAEKATMYAMIVLIAPICEELVFRGVIFRFLHKRMPLLVSTTVSGAIFAMFHFNLYSFASLMALGLTLAMAYRESGNIVSSMTLHAAFNSLSLLVMLSGLETS